MAESDWRPFVLGQGEGVSVWSLGGRFTSKLGEAATSDAPPAHLTMPGPDVHGPVAARYGNEFAGPPKRHR